MNRFDFEQLILRAWGTTEDINMIIQRHMDSPDGPLTEDQLMNLLMGIAAIHDARCAQLFEAFEALIKAGKIQ